MNISVIIFWVFSLMVRYKYYRMLSFSVRRRLDIGKKREILLRFIRNNPNATYKSIRESTKLHPERIFGSLEEAFKAAEINPPRTFKRMTKDEKRQIIINYIKKNPNAGGQTITKDTKINFLSVFKDTKEAFKAANVFYPRENFIELIKRDANERRQKIIKLLRENPLMSFCKIGKLTNTRPHSLFKNTREIYNSAGLPFFSKGDKRRINKQNLVIDYIKKNNLATQREINFACKTKVQELFKRGIFKAYEKAGILFPYERLKLHGTALKEIKDSAVKFEEDIARKLFGYGNVNRLVKTKRGIADIILERRSKKSVIEVKNYLTHEISISQIKQLNKYLEDINSNLGFLVCLKKPKKDNFLIGENRIFVILESELSKIPEIMDLW